MNSTLARFRSRLFEEQWVIGITRCDLASVIRSGEFNPDITWLPVNSRKKYWADPFIYKSREGRYDILFEEFGYREDYGKISVMTVDDRFQQFDCKQILDTQSHLSYPFLYRDNGKTYVFPESADSGKLSCYEYDEVDKSLRFIRDIVHLPLLDCTIVRHEGRYWLFGAVRVEELSYQSHVFYSDSLFGPYQAHIKNPIKFASDGIRSAGSFIEVDGAICRPTQNCENSYGESITINKISVLNEQEVIEEMHMRIRINKSNRKNRGIYKIHTINGTDDLMVVDGTKWILAPSWKLKKIVNKVYGRPKKESTARKP